MVKKRYMITMDEGIHDKAQNQGYNISALAEKGIEQRINPGGEIRLGKIEFEFEEKSMDSVSGLFSGVAVRARRCNKCSQIWFVNDPDRDWKICKECRNDKG
jgi:hypothetical protein